MISMGQSIMKSCLMRMCPICMWIQLKKHFLASNANVEEKAETLLAQGTPADWRGMASIEAIGQEFQIENTHLIKPGVGETTRVLLRRIPWKILDSAWISGEAKAYFASGRGQRRSCH